MKIIYNKTNKYHIGKIILQNGENEVSKEEWDVIKTHPQVKHFIKAGVISTKNIAVPVEETQEETVTAETKDVKDMNVINASKYIDTITSIEELEKILSEEDRKGVKKAVKKQLKALKEINNV